MNHSGKANPKKSPYNSLCNSSKSRQIMISFQTSQDNSNRAGGHEIPSERHALCILQAFGYAYADVLTGYECHKCNTHPPAAANLPCLTGSSTVMRGPQFLRSACLHLGATSAPLSTGCWIIIWSYPCFYPYVV